MDAKTFRQPGNEYRNIPFWSWNDDLVDEELIRQIRDMAEQGCGGVFMHSRVGLVTPYLSDEWMDRIKACVQEAKRTSMGAWLYDEDKWPSGYAAGIVPRRGPEYRQHALILSEERPAGEHDQILAVYAADGSGGWKRIPEKESTGSEGRVAYVYRWIEPMGNPWFNGTTYVDLMNPRVTDAFLQSTYEAYKRVVGDEFGTTIPGVFTDEPCCLMRGQIRAPAVPWTDGLPDRFQADHGYDLCDHLISLFYDVGDHPRVRYDYWRTTLELFVENYSQRMYAWCDRNHLKYTGHYMAEDTLTSQIAWVVAAMPHYEFMHYPGMDHLGRNIHNLMTAKQVSSVAQQLAKERTLSEMYGCSGQHFSLEGQKWIADWHQVNGINLVNPHLSLYTMRGERKRDYPPNLFYQQPWWKYNRIIADYCARITYALTRGKRIVHILMLHPVESAWTVYTPLNTRASDELSGRFARLSEDLRTLSRDFDYGDESILARHGRVVGKQFIVGEQAYEVVIVPPSFTLRSSTLHLLKTFMEHGGPVIAVKPVPTRAEGVQSAQVWDVLRTARIIEDNKIALRDTLNRILPKDVEVRSDAGSDIGPIWYHHRREGHLDLYFLANTDLEKAYVAEVLVDTQGKVEEWDPLTGEQRTLPSTLKGDRTRVGLHFEPAGSHLFTVDRSQAPREGVKATPPFKPTGVEKVLDGPWRIERRDPNALTLDYCTVRIGEGAWSERMSTRRAYDVVREARGSFSVRYAFTVKEIPSRGVHLVLETPERFSLSVNGQILPYTDQGWWVDTTFKKVSLAGLLRSGENVVVLSGRASEDLEIESCYLIGDFGVWTEDGMHFQIGEEKDTVEVGDLGVQGYPFFAGTVMLSQTVELSDECVGRACLAFDGLDAIVTEVEVNRKRAGNIVWHPHRVEIGDLLREGANEIRITLTGSLWNLLGPHHHRDGELLSVGPLSFKDEAHWTDVYQFVPFGFESAEIVVGEGNSSVR